MADTPPTAYRFTAEDLRAIARLQRVIQKRTLGRVSRIGAIRHAVQVTLRMEELAAAKAPAKGATR